jgi:hypothetical protein
LPRIFVPVALKRATPLSLPEMTLPASVFPEPMTRIPSPLPRSIVPLGSVPTRIAPIQLSLDQTQSPTAG